MLPPPSANMLCLEQQLLCFHPGSRLHFLHLLVLEMAVASEIRAGFEHKYAVPSSL
jgi:hypothetical protein